MCYILLLLLLRLTAIIHAIRHDIEQPLVELEDGRVRGLLRYTVDKRKPYYVFQGIPYAEPPIGPFRFKPPRKNHSWNGTLDATNGASECVQGFLLVTGTEDCLYINIYVPKVNISHLPVVVYLHGGGFSGGNANYNFMGPDYFLEEDVIFVSFNYRLGIFGFLSTGDLEVPGNNGLRDQILALEWIQKNIEQFNGNRNAVTLAGQSAGASCVSYLMQCRKVKGLFRGAIMESGTSLNPWALIRHGDTFLRRLAQALGLNYDTSKTLIESLQKLEFRRLQTMAVLQGIAFSFQINPLNGLMNGPVIEPFHQDAIITGKSHKKLVNGEFVRIPAIIGFNSHEAAEAANFMPFSLMPHVFVTPFDTNSSNFVPMDMNVDNLEEANLIGRKIRNKYFKNTPLLSLNQAQIYKYISEDQFVRPIRETGFRQSKHAPVFFYEFSHEGLSSRLRSVHGAGHTEELSYLFRSFNPIPKSKKDLLVQRRMVKLWTNFIKYLNPTPFEDKLFDGVRWPLANNGSDHLLFLNIKENLYVETNPEKEAVDFWNGLYKTYGRPPFDTY